MFDLVLFGNEGTDVCLEATCSDTHDDEGNDEARQCRLGMNDDRRDRGDDHNDMADPDDSASTLACVAFAG